MFAQETKLKIRLHVLTVIWQKHEYIDETSVFLLVPFDLCNYYHRTLQSANIFILFMDPAVCVLQHLNLNFIDNCFSLGVYICKNRGKELWCCMTVCFKLSVAVVNTPWLCLHSRSTVSACLGFTSDSRSLTVSRTLCCNGPWRRKRTQKRDKPSQPPRTDDNNTTPRDEQEAL